MTTPINRYELYIRNTSAMSNIEHIGLGPCCVCERTENVHNIIMLSQRCIVPGHGWGCVICSLPSDGAVAVVCDACLGYPLRFACRGWPATEGRVLVEELPEGNFDHDEEAHAQETTA